MTRYHLQHVAYFLQANMEVMADQLAANQKKVCDEISSPSIAAPLFLGIQR